MSQSKSSYGVSTPKDTGRKQRKPQSTPESASASEGSEAKTKPVPACRCKSVNDWEWVETPYTDALADTYSPCEWGDCYPNGPPDPDETETVVRSRRYPSVIHRVEHQSVEADANTDANNESEESAWDHPFRAGDLGGNESVPVESVAEVRVGDGVAWDCIEIPLLVVGHHETCGMVVKGPSGGEYQLRTRYDGRAVVMPGRGCVENLVRVVIDNHHQPEPEAV